jgi:hypothetical protein
MNVTARQERACLASSSPSHHQISFQQLSASSFFSIHPPRISCTIIHMCHVISTLPHLDCQCLAGPNLIKTTIAFSTLRFQNAPVYDALLSVFQGHYVFLSPVDVDGCLDPLLLTARPAPTRALGGEKLGPAFHVQSASILLL